MGVGWTGVSIGCAIVAVAGDLAADAADRVADGERDGAEVEQVQVEHLAAPRPQRDADGAAHGATEPHEPRTREDVAEQVVLDGVVVLDDEVESSADEPTNERDDDHLVRPVGGLANLLQAPREHGPGRDEREREHDPEGLEGNRA